MSDWFEHALDELVPREQEPRRWHDVVDRASASRRRRLLAMAAAAVLMAVVVGAGGAFHRDVVDFFSADPAPEPIQIHFLRSGARTDMIDGPGHATLVAREVAKFAVDGEVKPFWVSPMKRGGFCLRWHTMGMCPPASRQSPVKIGFGGQNGEYGQDWFIAVVADSAIQRLELEYADGESVELPFVWVSAPIDSGFSAFQVPANRQRKGLHAVAVTGYDADGNAVERRELPVKSDPRWEAAADGLPRIADRTKKQTLFDFRDETGTRWTLTVAPAPEDKLCYAFNRGGGCVSQKFPATPPAVIPGGKTIMVCCTVAEGVAKVELLFQDGRRIEVKPVDGFLLSEIPSEQYSRGKRLETIVSRDASGNEVGRVDLKADSPGVYPCEKSEEVEYGYGQRICP
jgi:hypothetical protein